MGILEDAISSHKRGKISDEDLLLIAESEGVDLGEEKPVKPEPSISAPTGRETTEPPEEARRLAAWAGKPLATHGGGQEIAKAIETPGRGMRGAAIGLKKFAEKTPDEIISGLSPVTASMLGIKPSLKRIKKAGEEAIVEAGEAVKPEYEPKTLADKVTAFIGQNVGDAPAFTAITALAPEITLANPAVSRLAKWALEGGMVGGSFRVLHDMAREGEIKPLDTLVASGFGGVLGLGFGAANEAIARLAPAIEKRIIGELFMLEYRVKKGLGIPQETGLVPRSVAAEVISGKISMAQAARESREIFERELAMRRQGEESIINTMKANPTAKPEEIAAIMVRSGIPAEQANIQVQSAMVSIALNKDLAEQGIKALEAGEELLKSKVPQEAPITPEKPPESAITAQEAPKPSEEATPEIKPEAPVKPDVEFHSIQKPGIPGKPELPMFIVNKPGHPLQGSAVSQNTLEREGLPVPEVPTTESVETGKKLVIEPDLNNIQGEELNNLWAKEIPIELSGRKYRVGKGAEGYFIEPLDKPTTETEGFGEDVIFFAEKDGRYALESTRPSERFKTTSPAIPPIPTEKQAGQVEGQEEITPREKEIETELQELHAERDRMLKSFDLKNPTGRGRSNTPILDIVVSRGINLKKLKDQKLVGDMGEDVIGYLRGRRALKSTGSTPSQISQAIAGEGLLPKGADENELIAQLREEVAMAQSGERITDKEFEKLDRKIARLESEERRLERQLNKKSPKRMPSGSAATGAQAIGTFETVPEVQPIGEAKISTPEKEFKLFEQIEGLIRKYAKTIGEGYLPRNARGVYYPNTENIRIDGMNDLSVAAHEISHFLDHSRTKFSVLFKEGTTRGDKMRGFLTDLYEEYYPGGKRKHKLSKRISEGFATLLQKYTEMPTTITQKYPELVNEILTPGGQFYNPVFTEIINDLRGIVKKYQGLDANDKILSRITSGAVNVDKSSFLNLAERIRTEIADEIYPIEKLSKQAGVGKTIKDPSLWIRAHKAVSSVYLNNIASDRGYIGFQDGDFVKLYDYNWKTIVDNLSQEKSLDSFGGYLVARVQHFAYQDLDRLESSISDEVATLKSTPVEEVDARKESIKLIREQNAEYNHLKSVLEKDGFTRKEVDDAYSLNYERFKDIAEKFDVLTLEDLKILNSPWVQLVDDETFVRLSEKQGYASQKRQFYDELVGEPEGISQPMKVGKTKVSSMMRRTGSSRTIINPLYSAMRNHAEIMRKATKQIVYNEIAEIAGNFPELFQKQQLKAVPQTNGAISFPQEKDPNIIMARVKFKRYPILTDALVKQAIDENLTPQNLDYVRQAILSTNRIFTKGTTGLYLPFALTNFTIDQITAVLNTQNNYVPLYSPLKLLWKTLGDRESKEAGFLREYLALGGDRQTLVSWQNDTPAELFKRIENERKGLLKVLDLVDKGLDFLSTPIKYSEIITRGAEYVAARMQGKAQVVALEEASRVTAPFHHFGRNLKSDVAKTWVRSLPFYNASIQVLDQTARTLETETGRKRFAFISAVALASMGGAFYWLMERGTEKQKKAYLDLQVGELSKYIWFPSADGETLNRIKLPEIFAIPGTILNMIMADALLNADYEGSDYANALTSFLPQQWDVADPAQAFSSAIPQIIKPMLLTLMNKRDFPKFMPLENQTVSNLPSEFRYSKGTSPAAKFIGSTELAKSIGLSPIKLDFLLTGYVGRASGYLTGKPEVFNVLSSFNRQNYFTSGRVVQKYYDQRDKMRQQDAAHKKGLKELSEEELETIKEFKEHSKKIDKWMSVYRKLDLDKPDEKAEADELRLMILEEIEEAK